MLRYFFLTLALVVLLGLAASGLRGHRFSKPPLEMFSDMVRQPKVKAQDPSSFFADGRAARPPVAGTVPLGYEMPADTLPPPAGLDFSNGSDYLNTGKLDGAWGTGMPFTLSPEMMRRGQERFGIFCASCHGIAGSGDGVVTGFGLVTVQSLLQDRLRMLPDGEIFDTISHGKNTMLGLGDRVPVADRWAIIAYLRALQKSQGGATWSDVPEDERKNLTNP